LIEAWVVATRPRDVNGFGHSPKFAADGLSKVKRLFHLLADTDDFRRYRGIQIIHPNDVIGSKA
jgi:hypothetical protein